MSFNRYLFYDSDFQKLLINPLWDKVQHSENILKIPDERSDLCKTNNLDPYKVSIFKKKNQNDYNSKCENNIF